MVAGKYSEMISDGEMESYVYSEGPAFIPYKRYGGVALDSLIIKI
mgnify:CR=1 FL=1